MMPSWKAVFPGKIGQLAHPGILAHQQVILVAEIPGEGSELVTLGVGDAGKTEIERPGFDQLPDAGPRHQADGDLAAAAADQFVGDILVDAGIGIRRIEQAVIVQGQRVGTRTFGCRGTGESVTAEHEQ